MCYTFHSVKFFNMSLASFVRQHSRISFTNKVLCDYLFDILHSSRYFGYSKPIAEDVSSGMVYCGDLLLCNCLEGCDSVDAVNYLAEFLRHENDLFLFHIDLDIEEDILKDCLLFHLSHAEKNNHSLCLRFSDGPLSMRMRKCMRTVLSSSTFNVKLYVAQQPFTLSSTYRFNWQSRDWWSFSSDLLWNSSVYSH